jgi:hypothetical protein
VMDRPTYTFKIGQRVFYYAGGRGHKKRTGPFTVVALARLPDGAPAYRIKNRTHEHLAHEHELKLVLDHSKQPFSDE